MPRKHFTEKDVLAKILVASLNSQQAAKTESSEKTALLDLNALQNYFDRIKKVIKFLSELANGKGRARDSSPNSYYSQTGNFALGLNEYYGMPSGLMTPLGYWQIDTSCIVTRKWLEPAKEQLQLIPYWGANVEAAKKGAKFRDVRSAQGCHGPIWQIGCDMEGHSFEPLTATITGHFMSPSTKMILSYQEAGDLVKKLDLTF